MNPIWSQFVFLVISCCSVKLVNSCSQDTFDIDAKACRNGFFSSIKQNPKQDCSTPYNDMKNCINTVFYGCRNNTDYKALVTIASRAQTIIASESHFCKDGMLNSLKGVNLPDCRKKAVKKAKKCAASFYRKFSQNKTSPSLCRKYTKAKKCIARAMAKYCKKTERVQQILKTYQDTFNPYCPGSVDAQEKPVRSTSSPFGTCTEREYFIMTRVCMARFVQTLQKYPKKPCRWVFTHKLHNCAKDITLHCHKNDSNYVKQNIEKSFDRNRPFQERKFCDGIYFQLSYPSPKRNQCKKDYFLAKHKCEESYIATYKKNKADVTLCRKYAQAKNCAKNASLSLCKDTPQLRDEVNFIYDRFNPFCFNLSDPPSNKGRWERVTRESGAQRLTNTSVPTRGSTSDSVSSGGQSLYAKLLNIVVALCFLSLRVVVF
ncbi:hypothetical protein OS493_035193 [Desmophyllum pertusum]|uniref:Uncharacterized protein n=1 Tax=Desmophyllum pertusum TaxID=174260 RepID=A0A9W9ZWQ3_9CNID|nr:hypothetical protein OS493_035193 [Desmophyllum pertusum]